MAARDVGGHMLGRRLETVRAGFSRHMVLMLLIGLRERSLTGKALRDRSLVQARIHTHSLIEHEALAVVVLTAAFLEVLENAAVELEDGLESLALQIRPRLLAADATGTEHHDRLLLQLGRELCHGAGKLTASID